MDWIKQNMAQYWNGRAPGFSALRQRELNGPKRALWLAEFSALPRRPLDVLDIGTGTGFFAFLLAPLGHRVTGIDLSADMVAEARHFAARLGLNARFEVMDAEACAFAPASFDAIVTRNLTWALPHLDRAYRAWHALLRPGGLLVNFDADYCREVPGAPLPPSHAHRDVSAAQMAQYGRLKDALRPLQQPRPGWDRALLEAAGFGDICVDLGAWGRLYSARDEFYNPAPVFKITATSRAKGA